MKSIFKSKKVILAILCIMVTLAIFAAYRITTTINPNRDHFVGEAIDNLNGVAIYYNGGINSVSGRNLSVDGYNLGLRYQCVEFVKRYYYERLGHRMPDAYGHARDFFDPETPNGALNSKRNLLQFTNGLADNAPQADDIVVFKPTIWNPYGHVAIIASTGSDTIEIAQQNPGPFAPSRLKIGMAHNASGQWQLNNERVLGWLRRAS